MAQICINRLFTHDVAILIKDFTWFDFEIAHIKYLKRIIHDKIDNAYSAMKDEFLHPLWFNPNKMNYYFWTCGESRAFTAKFCIKCGEYICHC